MNLTSFELDSLRLAELSPLMDDYNTRYEPGAEWPNNVLSKNTCIYKNGTFARVGDGPSFDVDEGELALCQKLSTAAKEIVGDMEIGMGSEAADPFLRFFIAANSFDSQPSVIDPALIAKRFGGTLFPSFSIAVEISKKGE